MLRLSVLQGVAYWSWNANSGEPSPLGSYSFHGAPACQYALALTSAWSHGTSLHHACLLCATGCLLLCGAHLNAVQVTLAAWLMTHGPTSSGSRCSGWRVLWA